MLRRRESPEDDQNRDAVWQYDLGEEIKDWPYLTNEAVALIVEKGVRIVALSTPSIDRESDDGGTTNHKCVFKDQNRLVVEAANFGKVRLSFSELEAFPDCAKVHQFTVEQLIKG